MNRRRALVASFALTVGLLALLLPYVDWVHFRKLVSGLDPGWVTASVVIFLGYQMLRALRLRTMTEVVRIDRLFATLCVQSGIANALPSWLGEVALVYLLKRLHAVRLHEGTAALLVARALDLAILLMFLLVVASLDLLPGYARAVILLGLAALAVIWVSAVRLARRRSNRDRESRAASGAVGRLITLADDSLNAFDRFSNRRTLLAALGYTVLIRGLFLVFLACVMMALVDIAFSWTLALSILAAKIAVRLSPIKGVADFGTHEAAWFVALTLNGVEPSQAATVALGSHVVVLLAVLTTATVGGALLLVGGNRRGAPKETVSQ